MTHTVADWDVMARAPRQDAPDTGMPWRDNAFFAFWDLPSRVHGLVHVMTSPNSEGRRAKFAISVDGVGTEVVEPLAPGTFESESISFGMDGRITVDTPRLTAELTMSPRSVAGDFSASQVFPGVSDEHPLTHLQRFADMSGSVSAVGHSRRISGVGVRDRTWGYRDESAAIQEYFAVVVAFEDRGMSMLKFRDGTGKLRAHGFLLGDGADAVTTLTDAAITRDSAGLLRSVTVDSADGDRLELELVGRRPGFWLHMARGGDGPTMSAYEDFVSLRTADGREAHGVCEQGITRTLL